jgi:glycosyltransferase involved in cell wall biosynthesis
MSTETLTPRVSIIIPVYQGDRFLAEALESVLNQTYINYEIIVVDDGSTDNSLEVLEHYFEKIRYVFQENQGVAAARNYGIKIAKGELIAFLDQDDLWLPDKLALQVACFDEHPELGIVHCGWQRVNAIGETLGEVKPWENVPILDLAGWLQSMPILLSAMIFKRESLERIGRLDTRFKQACDVDLVQRLALKGCQTRWVRDILVHYREHDRNDSLNTPLQAIESWAVREQFFASSDIPEPIRQIENQCCYCTLVWIAWRLYHTGYFGEMADYLNKSLTYTPYSRTKTVSDWVKNFKRYGIEYGYKLNIDLLSNSVEWQQLIDSLFLRVRASRLN